MKIHLMTAPYNHQPACGAPFRDCGSSSEHGEVTCAPCRMLIAQLNSASRSTLSPNNDSDIPSSQLTDNLSDLAAFYRGWNDRTSNSCMIAHADIENGTSAVDAYFQGYLSADASCFDGRICCSHKVSLVDAKDWKNHYFRLSPPVLNSETSHPVIARSQLTEIVSTCVHAGFDQSAEGFNSEHGNDLRIESALRAESQRLSDLYEKRFLNSASPSAPVPERSADSPAGACQPGGATLKRYRPVIYGGHGEVTEYGMIEDSKGEWVRFTRRET